MNGDQDKKQQMNIYLEEIKRLERIREKALETTKDLLLRNIGDLRNFFIHLTTISVLIMAFLLPVLADDNQTLFKTVVLVILGVVPLALVPVISTLYLSKILSKENNKLSQIRRFNEKTLKDATELLYKNIKEGKDISTGSEEYLDLVKKFAKEEIQFRKEDKKEKKDYTIDVISISFVWGIILVGLSLFDWISIISSLLQYIN